MLCHLYTDGSYRGKAVGGWAWRIECDESYQEGWGYFEVSHIDALEAWALLQGVRNLDKDATQVVAHTDSLNTLRRVQGPPEWDLGSVGPFMTVLREQLACYDVQWYHHLKRDGHPYGLRRVHSLALKASRAGERLVLTPPKLPPPEGEKPTPPPPHWVLPQRVLWKTPREVYQALPLPNGWGLPA